MTIQALAEIVRRGLASTTPGEFEEAVLAASRLTCEDLHYYVGQHAPIETDVFIDRVELRVAQLKAEIAMHEAALLCARQSARINEEAEDAARRDRVDSELERVLAATPPEQLAREFLKTMGENRTIRAMELEAAN